MNNPLISIITVVYNGAATLERTVLSVVSQTYKNIEYIIIDGGSTDGTIDIIKKYEEHLACWVSEPDKGIYDAMNKGINKAKGEIIGLINSDDWYEERAMETVANIYNQNKNHVILGLVRVNHGNNNNKTYVYGYSGENLPETMIAHPGAFVPKAIYNLYGTYNPDYKYSSDYDFFIRLKKCGVKFVFTEKILTNFSYGGISYSSSSKKETLKVRMKHNLISRFEYFVRRLALLLQN
jgi:glycosyltransferase involved in cell wall biosynthesis